MAKPTQAELLARFSSHRVSDESGDEMRELSRLCFSLAVRIVDVVPEGRQLSLALTALEEVRMRANAGICEPQAVQS